MPWFNKTEEEKKKEAGEDDLEIKTVKEKLGKIDSLETNFNSFKTESEATNKRLTSFLDEQEEAKRKAKADDLAKKAQENNKQIDDDLDELFLTDPRKASEVMFERKSQGLTQATINTQSQLLRKQIFEDNPDMYEYYDKANPEFKAEVDKLVDGLPLAHRTDPGAIKNCYAVAAFNKQKEIKEGKLKSRFAATSTSGTGTSGAKEGEKTLTELQKKAAAALGIKEEDYYKEAKEMNYV